jgi:hypothetical protein
VPWPWPLPNTFEEACERVIEKFAFENVQVLACGRKVEQIFFVPKQIYNSNSSEDSTTYHDKRTTIKTTNLCLFKAV